MKRYHHLSNLVLGLSFAGLWGGQAMAQLEKIEKKVDQKIEAAKKTPGPTPNPQTPPPPGPSPNPGPQDGRAIFSYDPAIDDDFGLVNYGATLPAKKEEELKLPEAQRGLDTAEFKARMFSVKRRDQLRYRQGQNLRPIINTPQYSKKHTLKKEVKVFGWHPAWMQNAYESYNFSLLSAVAYFSYELNPADGNYRQIHDWATTGLIEKAQKQGCKVLLSVSCFGEENLQAFLSNRSAQRNCINTVIGLVQSRKANGIHLDFENIPAKNKEDFTDFVLSLGFQLKNLQKDAWLTLSLPTFDFDKVYEVGQLASQVDLFVMGGYEFYGSNSQTAGPIAPVGSGSFWWQMNLEAAVDEYLAAGTPPEKLLLTVPYYGAEWVTESLQVPSSAKKFIDYAPYREIVRQRPQSKNEAGAMSAYAGFLDANNNYHQVWFEDSLSLAQKYDWVQKKKIGGVAIWALGYDNGHTKLWEALATKMAAPPPANAKQLSVGWFRRMIMPAIRIVNNPSLLLKNPRYLFRLFGVLTGVSLLGFLVLYRYGCRMKRSFNLGLKGIISLVMLSMLVLVFVASNNYQSTYITGAAFLIGGFIIGALVFLFLSRRFLSEQDLP
ncbi:MAG: hypothetical protein OHK0053_27530 [Microscillaceae bacterium]